MRSDGSRPDPQSQSSITILPTEAFIFELIYVVDNQEQKPLMPIMSKMVNICPDNQPGW